MVLASKQRAHSKSVDELLAIWEKSVGRGGQLVLGIAPDTRGLLPEADVKRLQAMGVAIQACYGAGKNLVPVHLEKSPKPSLQRWMVM